MKKKRTRSAKTMPELPLHIAAGRALRRSARVAREISRATGAPLILWRDGKIVRVKL